MKKLPTDREILRHVYTTYLSDYPGICSPEGKHSNDPYLGIKIEELADALNCSAHLLFGRLRYGLERFNYEDTRGVKTMLFGAGIGGKGHAVNFPLLVSVLAEMENSHKREQWSLWLSILSLIVASIALAVRWL